MLTGAGVSAASGIPTFRGAAGFWKQFRPEQLATRAAFDRDPALVWEWYDWRRRLIAQAQPNAAHHVLTAWASRFAMFTLITQNVDGLHERAGNLGVVSYHGSIWRLRCSTPCAAGARDWDDLRAPLPELPPRCPHCGAPARPGVVWFGEAIPHQAQAAASDATSCDVFLTAGTSSVVYPAASLVHEAARRGAFTAEINVEATGASTSVDVALEARAEEALPAIDRALSAPS